jgi:ribosomal protein S18 acetylase RimI-like enzyme
MSSPPGSPSTREARSISASLLDIYREYPCQVLPNAYWKTACRIEQYQYFVAESQEAIDRLALWDDIGLYCYWSRDRHAVDLPDELLQSRSLVLLHQDFLESISGLHFTSHQVFFRLIHHHQVVLPAHLQRGFRFREVDGATECDRAAAFIGRCYPELNPSDETVKSWKQHPVFAPELWVWVIDVENNVPAALGIAELDPNVNEASLEWIQVLPEYRAAGLGKAIVRELLRRVHGRVAFTTVSGEMEENANHEAFYRRCGFSGDDTWHVLRI